MAADTRTRPIRVALINDYDVVLIGLAHMFDRYQDRVTIAEIDAEESLADDIDVVLYDDFAQPEPGSGVLRQLVDNPHAHRVVVYTWNFHRELVDQALSVGVRGYVSKTLAARDLVAAIEAVQAGEVVVSDAPPRSAAALGLDWPGRREGISDREAEVLALITQGRSNAEIAEITYLSPNTVKTYIRSVYRKIGVTSRTQAVLWGVRHGFAPDHRRIDNWVPSAPS
ncbi:response regulator transcription factor [Amnibacterium sp. CER49]|uniref:response regulator transcription factor n=1 Tax=Amnibacterium sp. CER49 TaxID=3039161 RepID=UPI00244A6D59|nr:response regulator transcription factor [Amnibacterium sp. CER49]MDH2443154.1 response regulator transcription factor [Amnibacterium sp. CER49]